ncbi:MAG TPA: hypothetical protein VGR98_27965 [Streptosporangiaceae bacterium]|nr:hypothetical protein [Streptosporangiaceae bacterium]
MAGISPAGPVSGVRGLVFVDDNPEAPAEVVTGNPGWPQPGAPGYQASPLRYPGQMYSLGYGEYPTLPDPQTDLIAAEAPVMAHGDAGPSTPYFDATPNTHAGPWPKPVTDSHLPDGAAFLRQQSDALHSDGLDNRKPGLNIAPVQDQWAEYYNGPVDGALVGDGGQNKHASAGWGSTDITSHPANTNQHTDWPQHFHRRVATGRNLPMNFLWLPGGQRPLVNTVHGLQAFPVASSGPYGGQDPAYGYGSAGAVLTMPQGEYQSPASPWQPPPVSQQGLLEAPL